MKYIVAVIGFMIIWFTVAIALGFVMEICFPPPQDNVLLLYSPGIIVGFFAALHSWLASLRVAEKKCKSPKNKV